MSRRASDHDLLRAAQEAAASISHVLDLTQGNVPGGPVLALALDQLRPAIERAQTRELYEGIDRWTYRA